MAKVSGQGIDKNGTYSAREAGAKGLYWMSKHEGAERPPEAPRRGLKVWISPETATVVAKQKKQGESLESALNRLVLAL